MNAADTTTSPPYTCISAQEAAHLLRARDRGSLPLALFDVRDAGSFERGHLSGAQNLNMRNFPRLISKLPRSTPVLVYCYHGNASQTYAAMFADFRFAEVYSVDGGYAHLAELGLGEEGAPAAPAGATPSAALAAFLAEHGFAAEGLQAAGAQGLSPLMRAALLGRTDLVDELIGLGVDLNQVNGDGNNALWLACVGGEAAVLRSLAKAGIDLDRRNELGSTPLMYAASSGRADMVALLLELGADPLVRNFDDARAGDLCANLACLKLLRHTVN